LACEGKKNSKRKERKNEKYWHVKGKKIPRGRREKICSWIDDSQYQFAIYRASNDYNTFVVIGK
jgi:hypothetical protein